MIARDAQELSEILQRVLTWTPQSPLTLARRIIESLESQALPAANEAGKRGPPIEELIGMGAGADSPPSDAEVSQWIDEHRTRES